MHKYKILHTLCRVASGGVEQRRLLLAKSLPKDRFEHALIVQEGSSFLFDKLRAEGWEVHEIGIAPHILSLRWHESAYKIAKSFQPDIVHGAVYEGQTLACGIGLRMPKVKVVLEETSDPVNRRWTGNALMRAMCLRADACVGVSTKVIEYLDNTLHIPSSKIHLINNAVSEESIPSSARLSELRAALGIKENDIIIGSVGRVEDSHKRFSDIIRALPAIRSQYPMVRLLIVGDGPDAGILARLAEDLGLAGAVIWAGYQSSPRDYYHLMDMFVLASAHEAFGLVLVEAMLAKLPIVATNVGGIPGVVSEGNTAYLVEPYQPKMLAEAVIKLINNETIGRLMGQRGYKRARDLFSADRYVRDVDRLYRSLLMKRKIV